ncbi:SRPBCC family protein [Streptomyces sp. NPDC051109]|uniref:SRPBCC family protein n=1 Tax=Streptomyces sp. NPDC051109 TaxID=3365642 RepID=UPI0026A63586
MIQVARTMLIPCPMHDAVVYLADFAHTQEWDPATVSCVPLAPGASGPGSRWRNVSRFRGRTRDVNRLADDVASALPRVMAR